MIDSITSIIVPCTAVMVAIVALAVGLLMVIDRVTASFYERQNTPERRSAERIAYEAALLRPNWWFYEQHLQRPIPEAVRTLYADRRLLLSAGFEYDDLHYISEFGSIDPGSVVEPWEGVGVVPLASSDGDIIYLLPGGAESNVVYLRCHDGHDTYELAPDPGMFLHRLREAAAEAALRREVRS